MLSGTIASASQRFTRPVRPLQYPETNGAEEARTERAVDEPSTG
jgi:hypothetical protein